MRRMQRLAAEAIEVAGANNLDAVLGRCTQVLEELYAEAYAVGENIEWARRHPIAKLWAAKVADLTGLRVDTELYADALKRTQKIKDRR